MQGHKQYRILFLPYETVLELVFQDWYGRSTVSDPEFLYFVYHPWSIGPIFTV